jgi:hypothetical protein
MPLTPTQFSEASPKRQEPIDLRRGRPPARHQKVQNPKWTDDAWFEKRYGDPDYYNRIQGLS